MIFFVCDFYVIYAKDAIKAGYPSTKVTGYSYLTASFMMLITALCVNNSEYVVFLKIFFYGFCLFVWCRALDFLDCKEAHAANFLFCFKGLFSDT